jgi:hypothetical protein
MAVPHMLLSTEQYNRLKNKIQEYESRFSNQKSENITNSIGEGENEKETKNKEENPEYESKISRTIKDKNKSNLESGTGKRSLVQNEKPKIKKIKKKSKVKDKIIKKDEIIKMMTPPGEREEIYSIA